MTDRERQRDKQLIANLEAETRRLRAQVRELTRQIEHYHGKWGKRERSRA
jgi:uncharacterized protein YlxW (UPF0749 family)